MDILNKKCNQLIKRICVHPISEKSLMPDEIEILYDLLKRGYIYCINPEDGYTDTKPSKGFNYAITLEGQNYVESVKRNFLRYYTPLIVSIIALIVSILTAIFK